MTAQTQLVVALDFPDSAQALDMARQLRGTVTWLKVGLELYLASGRDVVNALKDMGFFVFVDLKFMDIPNTVRAATAQLTRLGADMLTIHALGGHAMCQSALDGRAEALPQGQQPPLILGVTLLTSLAPRDLVWNPSATETTVREQVLTLARAAQAWKLDGVVCSGQEVRAIRQACHDHFHLLTPGIRLPGAQHGDQARVCTPAQAKRDGSTFLVVGRPITRSENAVHAARRYLEEVS